MKIHPYTLKKTENSLQEAFSFAFTGCVEDQVLRSGSGLLHMYILQSK